MLNMQLHSILLFIGVIAGTQVEINYNATATFYKTNSAPDIPENYGATLVVTGYHNFTCQFTVETPKCSRFDIDVSITKHLDKDWIEHKYSGKDRTLPFVPQFSFDRNGVAGIYPEYGHAIIESDKTYFHFESVYFGSGGRPDIHRG